MLFVSIFSRGTNSERNFFGVVKFLFPPFNVFCKNMNLSENLDEEAQKWCDQHGWSDLFTHEDKYYAFPPGAVIPQLVPLKITPIKTASWRAENVNPLLLLLVLVYVFLSEVVLTTLKTDGFICPWKSSTNHFILILFPILLILNVSTICLTLFLIFTSTENEQQRCNFIHTKLFPCLIDLTIIISVFKWVNFLFIK